MLECWTLFNAETLFSSFVVMTELAHHRKIIEGFKYLKWRHSRGISSCQLFAGLLSCCMLIWAGSDLRHSRPIHTDLDTWIICWENGLHVSIVCQVVASLRLCPKASHLSCLLGFSHYEWPVGKSVCQARDSPDQGKHLGSWWCFLIILISL